MRNPTRSSKGANNIDTPVMERLAVSTFGPPILVAQGALRNGIEFVGSRAPFNMPKSLPGRSRKYYRASPGGFEDSAAATQKRAAVVIVTLIVWLTA